MPDLVSHARIDGSALSMPIRCPDIHAERRYARVGTVTPPSSIAWPWRRCRTVDGVDAGMVDARVGTVTPPNSMRGPGGGGGDVGTVDGAELQASMPLCLVDAVDGGDVDESPCTPTHFGSPMPLCCKRSRGANVVARQRIPVFF